MENKIHLKKVLFLEFSCHYVTELALRLHVIQRITTINLPLLQSCFFEAFYSVTACSGFSFVEYGEQYITWLQGQRPNSNIHNNVIVHSSLTVAGNGNLKYFFFFFIVVIVIYLLSEASF